MASDMKNVLAIMMPTQENFLMMGPDGKHVGYSKEMQQELGKDLYVDEMLTKAMHMATTKEQKDLLTALRKADIKISELYNVLIQFDEYPCNIDEESRILRLKYLQILDALAGSEEAKKAAHAALADKNAHFYPNADIYLANIEAVLRLERRMIGMMMADTMKACVAHKEHKKQKEHFANPGTVDMSTLTKAQKAYIMQLQGGELALGLELMYYQTVSKVLAFILLVIIVIFLYKMFSGSQESQ